MSQAFATHLLTRDRSILLRTMEGLTLSALVVLMRVLAEPLLGNTLPLVFFFPAIAIVAATSGIAGAVSAIVVAASYFTVGWVVRGMAPSQVCLPLISFLGSSALVTYTAHRLRKVVQLLTISERRLALALEFGGLGSWELDVQSGSASRNRIHDRIFGYAEPLPDWGYDDFVRHLHPDDRDQTVGAFTYSIEAMAPLHFECRIRRADTSEFRWIEVQGRPTVDGGITYLLGTVLDVTERKATELELRQAHDTLEHRVQERTAELEAINLQLRETLEQRDAIERQLRQSQKMDAIGQLTGGIAHDFNNMLASVSGNLELAQLRIEQGRSGQIERYLTAAHRSTERAATLTQRLLAFARQQTLAPGPVDIRGLLENIKELIERSVGPGIDIEWSADPGLWMALIDRNQLENALLNICLNARDAMPEGGHLQITADNLSVDTATHSDDLQPGAYVVVSVSDDGSGMPPDVVERAFDPFFTTKPVGKGTGLGLSMVHGFVNQSGGQVRLRSTPGRGSTIAMYLPRCSIGVAHTPGQSAASLMAFKAHPGRNVLIVDDEVAVRAFVTDMLESLNHHVIQATDGFKALDILRSEVGIDLLITDVGLPGMNGRQVADAARRLRPNLKVLFITGYAENAVLCHGDLEPGMEILLKPFTMEAIAVQIMRLTAAGSEGRTATFDQIRSGT